MAADYITVNRSRRLGDTLVRSADLLRELREMVDKLQDAGSHSFDGSDYALMEDQFGLGSGSGANVLAMITILGEILNTSTDKPGADRLSQLDEYCARLAGQ